MSNVITVVQLLIFCLSVVFFPIGAFLELEPSDLSFTLILLSSAVNLGVLLYREGH